MADVMDVDPPRGTKRKAEEELDDPHAPRRIKVLLHVATAVSTLEQFDC